MKEQNASKGLIGAGILTAFAASLCCITPILALIAGSSGMASTFSWLEPARPYLIATTLLVIGFVWYQKLKPKPSDKCGCETHEKPNFLHSKTFLGITTIFAALMIAFPYYSTMFLSKNEKKSIIADNANIQSVEFPISGMTCSGCEEIIKHEVNKLNGIIKVEASYKNSNAQIQFDNTKTTVQEIEQAINSTAYKVTIPEIKK